MMTHAHLPAMMPIEYYMWALIQPGSGLIDSTTIRELFLPTLTSADGISEDLIFPGGMLHDGNVLYLLTNMTTLVEFRG